MSPIVWLPRLKHVFAVIIRPEFFSIFPVSGGGCHIWSFEWAWPVGRTVMSVN